MKLRLNKNKQRPTPRRFGRRGGHESLEPRCLLTTLVISEINYEPYDPVPRFGETAEFASDFEFIELLNTGTEAVSLEGIKLIQVDVNGDLEGVDFAFGNQSLAANQRLVVAKNLPAFRSRYGAQVPVVGPWTGGGLSNNGELLTLVDAKGDPIVQFEYGSDSDWPTRAAGWGASLEIKDVTSDPDDATNWRSSFEYGGSPGRAPGDREPRLQINEVLAHTDLPKIDTLELHNLTDAPIDISGWYLSDDIDKPFGHYRFPANTPPIPAHGYRKVDATKFNPGGQGVPPDFALSEFGEDLLLISDNDADPEGGPANFEDVIHFGATINGVSVGNVNDVRDGAELLPLAALTLGSANGGHRISDLVISEIQYQAADNDVYKEYIELFNRTDTELAVDDWRISEALEAIIPAGTTLDPGETLVLVAFDPNDQLRASAFREYYEIDAFVRLIGPWSTDKSGKPDSLSNSGETVTLRLPLPDRELNETFYGAMDQIDYRDNSPWPDVADGHGGSLSRTAPETYGNLPASWQGTRPSPGNQPPNWNASPALVVGQLVADDLGSDGSLARGDADIDTYRFQPPADGRFKIRTDAEGTLGADTYLRLFDLSGQELAYSDSQIVSKSSQVELQLEGGTDYLVVVSGSSPTPRSYNPFTGAGLVRGSRGTYQLSVEIVVVNPFPWRNADLPEDVSGDGEVVPYDALLIINQLNEFGSGPLSVPPVAPNIPPPFLDVFGDNILSPIDALTVINFLNVVPAAPNRLAALAEAEPADAEGAASSSAPDSASIHAAAAATPSVDRAAARQQAVRGSRVGLTAAAVDEFFARASDRARSVPELTTSLRRRVFAR